MLPDQDPHNSDLPTPTNERTAPTLSAQISAPAAPTIASTEAYFSESTARYKSETLIGVTLDGRYFVEKELSHGGVGVVYLGRDRKLLNKPVVVKILLQSSLQNEWTVQKFQQEKEALARVDHPGVVGIVDTGELPDGNPYIVMQYVDGVTLRSIIPLEGIGLERAATIAKQIGAALSAVHKMGIYHRDLKPENIMLQVLASGDEQVKIVDFGIAKVKDSLLGPSTVVPATAGTIVYMSPEQLRGEKVTAMSDVYSMGVVAFEMVTGRRPFSPQTIAHLSELQREGVRVKPKDLRPYLPEAAQDAILKALSYHPNNRFQGAREFGSALCQALLCKEDAATHNRSDEKSPEIPPVENRPVRAGKSPALLILAAVLAVVVLVLGTIVIVNKLGTSHDTAAGAAGNIGTARLPERSLSYWLTVQKMREGKPYQEPFESSGQEIFENGWKFQMNLARAPEGHVYLLNEGPTAGGVTTYNLLFPEAETNGGSSRISRDQKLQTAWMRFDDHQGTEKFWIIWAASPVRELAEVSGVVTERQQGEISDPDHAKAVRNFIEQHSSPKPDVAKDSAKKQTTVTGKGDIVVSFVELEHH
jgi:serine/threonine protein kinase